MSRVDHPQTSLSHRGFTSGESESLKHSSSLLIGDTSIRNNPIQIGGHQVTQTLLIDGLKRRRVPINPSAEREQRRPNVDIHPHQKVSVVALVEGGRMLGLHNLQSHVPPARVHQT